MPQKGPQETAIRRHLIDEIFFGGAVGGGKSDFLLGDFAQDVPNYGSSWQGILFRKTYPELSDLIRRSQEIYPSWFPGVEWHESDKEWLWPNGAILRMRYLESATDWMRYWGHAYSWIGWDELPMWPDLTAYHKMKARLRSATPIPNKRIRSTGNPGGPGHHLVKEYFGIDLYPLGGQVLLDEASGMRRLFIRSRLSDNKILAASDPNYAKRLNALGNSELVRAWLEGDWTVIAGAFFPEFSAQRHIIQACTLPSHWTRFRAMDWGSAKPFSVGWYAVSDGELGSIPRGCLVKYREWYGAAGINVGLKLTAEEVADGIKQREGDDKITYSVLDPAAFSQDGGPSIAERMADRKVFFDRADNKRVRDGGAMGGWDQVRARLKGDEEGPGILFFETCKDTIRTIPALQHDQHKPEDVDTDAEDHAGDETRYACMSRPYAQQKPAKKRDMLDKPTMNELWENQPKSSGRI